MSDEQLQESATSEPQTNAREQELLKSIEALERKNKEIIEEKRKFSKVEKTLQTLPEGVDVQALIDYKNKAEQQKLEEQGNYKEAIQRTEEQFRERSAAKDKEIEELKARVQELELVSPAIQALAEVTHNPKLVFDNFLKGRTELKDGKPVVIDGYERHNVTDWAKNLLSKDHAYLLKNQPATGSGAPIARTGGTQVNTGEFDPEMMRRLANGEHTVKHELYKKYGREGWLRAEELAKNYK
ncbi:MAG: hypothetical protein VXY88_00215 [Bacteroidota bacterium]|nr:hypothetical protein [Bacteroidota bacterium]